MDTYSLVTLLSLRFRAREERRRVARTIPFSLSLSLDDRKTPLPSNFSIKHSRDAKFGREEILARVSSASLANLPLFIYSPWRFTSWRATLPLVAENK